MQSATDDSVIFRFNLIWRGRSMAALVLSWKLAESDISVKPSSLWIGNNGDIITRLM